MLSDIYVKGTGRMKPEKDWGYYQRTQYEEGMLCINDKSTVFEITGVNNTGQWLVKRIWQ